MSKEITLEEAKKKLNIILSYYDEYKKDIKEGHGSSYEIDIKDFEAIERVLQALEKFKKLAEINFKDGEEFKKNMCNHRCVKNAEVQEFKEYMQENSIPKKKIEDVITQLIKEGDYRSEDNPNGRIHFQAEPCDYQIQILQELLESEVDNE